MVAYVVEQLDPVQLDAEPPLSHMGWMSPFVWREEGRYRMLMRGVPDPLGLHDPTGLIFAGLSDDGLVFRMGATPVIAPGPGAVDAGGVEDPTVEPLGDRLMVFYTGVDAARAQGALLVATGPNLDQLEKRAATLKAPAGEGNIKEATIATTSSGDRRLFFEYAKGGASRIGLAGAPALGSAWQVLDDPFGVRADAWDSWHLSTGPIVCLPGHDPVMFYNGATVDARWRIGWISFDADFTRVTARGIEPLLVPPPAKDRAATDIAFAASALVEDGRIALYYSLEDRLLNRAIIHAYT